MFEAGHNKLFLSHYIRITQDRKAEIDYERCWWLDEGGIGGCEVLGGPALKLRPALQLDLFDLCTPGEVGPTGHGIELGLQNKRGEGRTSVPKYIMVEL